MRNVLVSLGLLALVAGATLAHQRGDVSSFTLTCTLLIAVGLAWKVAHCPHVHTVWERRALDGTCRPVPADEAVFWFVCADCGRPLSQVNQRHPSVPAA